ncbi:hypothetical protein KEM55_008182, partial [Ascosphaera atra]
AYITRVGKEQQAAGMHGTLSNEEREKEDVSNEKKAEEENKEEDKEMQEAEKEADEVRMQNKEKAESQKDTEEKETCLGKRKQRDEASEEIPTPQRLCLKGPDLM